MGLEMMGFTKANLRELWIDPVAYQRELYEDSHDACRVSDERLDLQSSVVRPRLSALAAGSKINLGLEE